jgi:glycosyltransferase involved in cell wall biosynthesis
VDLSYCVVNTSGRELLLACLASIREHAPAELESEVLVADNASDDGSAEAVEAWNAGPAGLGASGARARLRSTACCCERRGASSACC